MDIGTNEQYNNDIYFYNILILFIYGIVFFYCVFIFLLDMINECSKINSMCIIISIYIVF